MNIKTAKEEIKNTIEAYLEKDEYGEYEIPSVRQRPVLLIGPPGVGKTQIMEEIAKECGIAFVSYTITHHTRQSAVGLPYIIEKTYDGKNYSITEYTMSEIVASIYEKIRQTGLKEGMLFIDEINCVSETLAPTMLQFLQAKTFGSHKIPQGWIIAAAGNPPEYNKSVREFDIVTLDRIKMIPIEADFQVWKEYAYQVSVHPAIISYLSIKPQYFCTIETTVDGKFFATPRGWEDLSNLIRVYEKLEKKIDREVIFEYIQNQKIAKDFANYWELYKKYQNEYQIEEILEGKIREGIHKKIQSAPFDEKISIVSLLFAKLSLRFKKIKEEEELLETLMLCLRDFKNTECQNADVRMMEKIQNLTIEWKQKKQAELLRKAEEIRYQKAIEQLDEFAKIIIREDIIEIEKAWERIKELFSGQNEKYEKEVNYTGKMLENAFDFMEEVFGDSQEMVIFITELNRNYFSIHFLQEYECERYYEYNKRLLFEEEEKIIKRKLEKFQI